MTTAKQKENTNDDTVSPKKLKDVDDGDTKKTRELKAEADKKSKIKKPPTTDITGTVESSTAPAEPASATKAPAKAGKRSEKALKETEEKQAKEERKHESAELKAEAESKPKHQQKPARSKLERQGKNFQKSAGLVKKDLSYSLSDAMELAVQTNPTKFDATVELHIRLGVDPRQADQNIRDTVVLPAGTGKKVRIAVLADESGVAAAKKAGADIAGSEEFLQQLDKGVIDFDILIATPSFMPKLGKFARVLGPKGLMPNPKSGTVTTDVAKAVTEAKAGRLEYRVDSTGIVHVGIGKVSFGGAKLLQNAQAILSSIKQNKPSSLKGNYIKSIYTATSMGPSIRITINEA